jgi:uncharacterized protein YdhG (YjbR/CyaY superfamily)
VDAYLAALPEDVRAALETVRRIIRETVPDCTERVSYGIPMFRQKKDLVGLSAQKNHCSLHCTSSVPLETYADKLQGFKVSGYTIQFTPGTPLPRNWLKRSCGTV